MAPRRFTVAIALGVACVGAAVAAPFVCSRASGVERGPSGGGAAPPSSAPGAGASSDGRITPAPGPTDLAPIAGHGCIPGRDSVTCSPDGLEEIACAGNVWRTILTCRGPAHCKGEASKLSCDTGVPQPGDACIPTKAPPRCLDGARLLACTEGRWLPTACPAGRACSPLPGASAEPALAVAGCR